MNSESGEAVKSYRLPTGSLINVMDGDKVLAGDILAKIPREISKTRDITGGLPRVAELFEARRPKNNAIIAKISGTVSYGMASKGNQKLILTNTEGKKTIEEEYAIPYGKHMNVHEGDFIRAGEPLTEGPVDPQA